MANKNKILLKGVAVELRDCYLELCLKNIEFNKIFCGYESLYENLNTKFKVRFENQLFNLDIFDIYSENKRFSNIITCKNTWDNTNLNSENDLVVYSSTGFDPVRDAISNNSSVGLTTGFTSVSYTAGNAQVGIGPGGNGPGGNAPGGNGPGGNGPGGNPPGGNNNIIPTGSNLSNRELVRILRIINTLILSNRNATSTNVNMNDITEFIWGHIHGQSRINNPSLSVTVVHTTPLNFRPLIVPNQLSIIIDNPNPLYGGLVSRRVFADYERLRAQAIRWHNAGRPGFTYRARINTTLGNISTFNYNNPGFLN